MTEKIPFLFFSLPGFTCLPQSKLFCGRLFNMLKHKTSSEGFFFSLFCCPSCGFYVKFGVQSCLKINTCVRWSDVLCGFQPGKREKKQKQNQLDQGQTVKHNSAHKNLYALGWTFEVSYLFQIKKKRKKEIDIYIVSAECPWKVELHFAPFMLTLMHISYYFFFLPSWKLAAARVSGYWWVSRCCSSLHS